MQAGTLAASASTPPAADGLREAEELSPFDLAKGREVDGRIADGWTVCHAAAAALAGGRVILFPGRSGSGKSTLAAVLTAEGRAATDEFVYLRSGEAGLEARMSSLRLAVPASAVEALADTSLRIVGESNGKTLVEPRTAPGHVLAPVAMVLLGLAGRTGGVLFRRSPRDVAARALFANVLRFTSAGAPYAAHRKRAWGVVWDLVDGLPAFALDGDVLADRSELAHRLDEVAEGNCHVRP
jgi:hypothetical protein